MLSYKETDFAFSLIQFLWNEQQRTFIQVSFVLRSSDSFVTVIEDIVEEKTTKFPIL